MLYSTVWIIAYGASGLLASEASHCRILPGDSSWPSATDWDQFNRSIDGRLIATKPLAAPCHNSQYAPYDEAMCKQLQDAWTLPEIHYTDPTSIMAPYFANRSCDPFTGSGAQCIVGSYNYYTVNVSEADHVIRALDFSKKHNIRFAIRNTGHDYNGKSTGTGSLAVWLHHLKNLEMGQWIDRYYTGPAVKMGAGVQAFEVYEWAHKLGYAIVGGECPTVGIAGGYTQGGGHSALASRYGLAADQVLEWEVVDGTGRHLIARRDNENSDLYWALSGGGGGTYGVVLSLTSKLHQSLPVAGANITFSSKDISQDDYYDLITQYHNILPSIVDAGATSIQFFTNQSFAVSPITAPGLTAHALDYILQPYIKILHDRKINHNYWVGEFPSFLHQYNDMMPAVPVGEQQYGGRFVSRDVVSQKGPELTKLFRDVNSRGANVTIVALNVNKTVAGDPDNAVVPGWRTTLLDVVYTTAWDFFLPWKEMEKRQVLMTETLLPPLEALTPGANAYMNEGDFRQPGWEGVFYGENYARLLKIKSRYDPDNVFWASKAVGSEYWEEQPTDRRLCKAIKLSAGFAL